MTNEVQGRDVAQPRTVSPCVRPPLPCKHACNPERLLMTSEIKGRATAHTPDCLTFVADIHWPGNARAQSGSRMTSEAWGKAWPRP